MRIRPTAVTFRKISLYCAFLIAMGAPVASCQDEPSPAETTETFQEQIRIFMQESVFQSLGVSTGLVTSDAYDTGFGFGMSVSQVIVEPELPTVRFKTSTFFWGASRDSLDVTALGIEESVFFERSPNAKTDLFTGFTLGYYSFEEDTAYTAPGIAYTDISNTNRFNVYLGSGFRYWYQEARSVILQLQYVISRDTNEFQLRVGLEFFKPLSQNPQR